MEVNVGVLESYSGIEKNVTFFRKNKCVTCSGSGGERINCSICNGSGHISVRHGTGLFVQITRQVCHGCSGRGYNLKSHCHSCNGLGTQSSSETITIRLPQG